LAGTGGKDATGAAVVLGGTGFVGRHLCAALRRHGYRVVAVSRRPGIEPAGCAVRHVDLATAATEQLVELLAEARAEVVVNAAGAVWGASDDDLRTGNVTVVDNLLAAAGPEVRLIHLGSAYEYGAQPPEASVREDSTPHPVTLYARTKLAGSERVLAAAADRSAVVLRLSTVVGPGAPVASLFGSIAWRLANAEPADRPFRLELPPLAGKRDFLDVRDVADAVLQAARKPAVTGVVNIGSGRLVPVRAAVDRLIELSGVPVAVSVKPSSGPRRDAGIGSLTMCIDAARSRLGWIPRRDLTDALSALWSHACLPPSIMPAYR
jgi:NDP-hexose 4-ketoreductase